MSPRSNYDLPAWVNGASPARNATNLLKPNTAIDSLDTRVGTLEDGVVGKNTQVGTAYTLALTDGGKVVEMDNAAANTLTVPPNATVAFPVGTIIEVYRMGVGVTTVAAGTGVIVRNAGSLRAQYSTAALRKRATDEWVLGGDLT